MNYILRRVLIYVGVLLVITNLDFFLPRLVPGNAAEILAAGDRLPALTIASLSARFGLNQPLPVQYFDYMKGIFATWPPYFGISFQYQPLPVTTLFFGRLGWSMLLLITGAFLALAIAYLMGVVTAMRRKSKLELGMTYFSIAIHSTPIYWFAMILLWIFAVDLGWLPMFGNVGFNPGGGLSYFDAVVVHAILPITAMTISILGQNYLLLRGSVQEVLNSDYVTAAQTRGLKERLVSVRYVLRNSMLPILSLMTFSLGALVGRLILVESVFGYPGVGDLIVDAVLNRDYPVIEGTIFLLTVLVIVGGLIGDILLVRFDPRLRKQ